MNVGIDLGKTTLHVCVSNGDAPRHWPVTPIHLDTPDWDENLQHLVPPKAIVALEATGWHYMLPVVAALEQRTTRVWQIPSPTTGKIRAVQVAGSKSDAMDARALALAATWIASGDKPRGAYPYSTIHQMATTQLRTAISAYFRAKKERTRYLNRLDQLAFAVWPTLAQRKTTYLRAVGAGAATPEELRTLAHQVNCEKNHNGSYAHGNARNALTKLAASVPSYVTPNPAVIDAIRTTYHQLTQHDPAHSLGIIEALIQSPPFAEVTQRWLTIPAATPLAIATIHVASNGRVEDYTPDQLKSATGAAPQRHRSGDADRRGKARPGYRPAMTMTWFWTARLLKPDAKPNPVRDYYRALQRRNHQNPFRAAIAKLVRVISGVARDPNGYIYPK